MSRIFTKEYRLFLFIFSLSILFAAIVFKAVYPLHFGKQPLFFSDLLGFSLGLPIWIIYLFGILDIFIFWLIGSIFFKKVYAYLFMLFSSLSPWFIYAVVAGSFYIYLLCLLLIIFLGIYLILSNKQKNGGLIFIISSTLLLYSSLIAFLSYLLFISGLIFFKIVPLSKIKFKLIIIFIICLPLFIMMFKNTIGVKNILNNQINLFSDSGITNSINMFQGESKREGFRYLSKLIENKYFYNSRYMILKSIRTLVPSTFFTPEERILGSSFAPPIYIGLIIPFMYGLYLILGSKSMRKYLFISLILIIPSLFSEKIVDLNRLLLFEPVIIFIAVYGLQEFYKNKNLLTKIILCLSLALVLTQFLVTLSDINFREYPRFERYQGITHWQIDKQ